MTEPEKKPKPVSRKANPNPETNYCGVAGGLPGWGGYGNNRGIPHPDHPRRCTGRNRRDGLRCKQWGLKGTEPPLCPMHGGRQKQKAQKGWTRKDRLPYVYKKYLGPKLTEAVELATGIDPDEQTAVFHELALLREWAGPFVGMYSAAVEANNAKMMQETGLVMKEVLSEVVDVASKAAKIQEKQRDRFSIHDLKYVIDKIMLIHFSVCGDEHRDIAEKFAKAIEEQLTLPANSASTDPGTRLSPDDTARAFDATVPYVADDDDDEDDNSEDL